MNILSIIVPVYNGEKYLKNLIKSFNEFKSENVEFVFIDDGSKDNSFEIINEYSNLDKRIKLVKKKNGGICSARNFGIENSNSKYLMFVDQDDEVNVNNIEKNLNCILENDYDMVIGSYNIITKYVDKVKKQHVIYENKKYIDKKDILDLSLNINRLQIGTTIWNCIYKKEIIDNNNIKFNDKLRFGGEDNLFNFTYMINCKSIVTNNIIVYDYFRYISGNNTSMKYNENNVSDFLLSIEQIEKELLQHLEYDKVKKYISYLYLRGLKNTINYIIKYSNNRVIDTYLKKCRILFKNDKLEYYKKINSKIVKTNNKKYDIYIFVLSKLIFCHLYFIVFLILFFANKFDVTPYKNSN
ncbi:glycosyltransferase family 2 protein [Thomasclavelia spiroformis]|uniref:glycosyltransferase family 2 protein n=1 Tax=Thomasclavelia spiroformis TaxID=29348 RepID=UPI003995D467